MSFSRLASATLDFAHPFVVGDVAAGLLDGLRGGLLADGLDVARLVGDVGDVDVDQHQADLAQLRLQRALHLFQELFAIAVDVFDLHRGDHLPQLAEDHVLGLLLDLQAVHAPAGGWPRSASARALVPMATVNTLGTLTRMFSIDSAPRSGISICIGSRFNQP